MNTRLSSMSGSARGIDMPSTTQRAHLVLIATVLIAFAVQTQAQALPPNLPTKEELAKDNKPFITLASKALKWEEPTEPIKIVGPLYFVGTTGLSSWLFATPEGHILLNIGMRTSGPQIVERSASFASSPRTSRSSSTGTPIPTTRGRSPLT